MYHFIFIIEIILVIFYIDMKYGTSNSKYIQTSDADYSAYYYIDIVDNQILDLKKVPQEMKMDVWKSSPIQQEVLDYFPDMKAMHEVYNDRIEDDSAFKEKLLHKIEALQHAYIAGELNEKKFKESFLLLQ